jgi:hypothetical protein
MSEIGWAIELVIVLGAIIGGLIAVFRKENEQ